MAPVQSKHDSLTPTPVSLRRTFLLSSLFLLNAGPTLTANALSICGFYKQYAADRILKQARSAAAAGPQGSQGFDPDDTIINPLSLHDDPWVYQSLDQQYHDNTGEDSTTVTESASDYQCSLRLDTVTVPDSTEESIQGRLVDEKQAVRGVIKSPEHDLGESGVKLLPEMEEDKIKQGYLYNPKMGVSVWFTQSAVQPEVSVKTYIALTGDTEENTLSFEDFINIDEESSQKEEDTSSQAEVPPPQVPTFIPDSKHDNAVYLAVNQYLESLLMNDKFNDSSIHDDDDDEDELGAEGKESESNILDDSIETEGTDTGVMDSALTGMMKMKKKYASKKSSLGYGLSKYKDFIAYFFMREFNPGFKAVSDAKTQGVKDQMAKKYKKQLKEAGAEGYDDEEEEEEGLSSSATKTQEDERKKEETRIMDQKSAFLSHFFTPGIAAILMDEFALWRPEWEMGTADKETHYVWNSDFGILLIMTGLERTGRITAVYLSPQDGTLQTFLMPSLKSLHDRAEAFREAKAKFEADKLMEKQIQSLSQEEEEEKQPLQKTPALSNKTSQQPISSAHKLTGKRAYFKFKADKKQQEMAEKSLESKVNVKNLKSEEKIQEMPMDDATLKLKFKESMESDPVRMKEILAKAGGNMDVAKEIFVKEILAKSESDKEPAESSESQSTTTVTGQQALALTANIADDFTKYLGYEYKERNKWNDFGVALDQLIKNQMSMLPEKVQRRYQRASDKLAALNKGSEHTGVAADILKQLDQKKEEGPSEGSERSNSEKSEFSEKSEKDVLESGVKESTKYDEDSSESDSDEEAADDEPTSSLYPTSDMYAGTEFYNRPELKNAADRTLTVTGPGRKKFNYLEYVLEKSCKAQGKSKDEMKDDIVYESLMPAKGMLGLGGFPKGFQKGKLKDFKSGKIPGVLSTEAATTKSDSEIQSKEFSVGEDVYYFSAFEHSWQPTKIEAGPYEIDGPTYKVQVMTADGESIYKNIPAEKLSRNKDGPESLAKKQSFSESDDDDSDSDDDEVPTSQFTSNICSFQKALRKENLFAVSIKSVTEEKEVGSVKNLESPAYDPGEKEAFIDSKYPDADEAKIDEENFSEKSNSEKSEGPRQSIKEEEEGTGSVTSPKFKGKKKLSLEHENALFSYTGTSDVDSVRIKKLSELPPSINVKFMSLFAKPERQILTYQEIWAGDERHKPMVVGDESELADDSMMPKGWANGPEGNSLNLLNDVGGMGGVGLDFEINRVSKTRRTPKSTSSTQEGKSKKFVSKGGFLEKTSFLQIALSKRRRAGAGSGMTPAMTHVAPNFKKYVLEHPEECTHSPEHFVRTHLNKMDSEDVLSRRELKVRQIDAVKIYTGNGLYAQLNRDLRFDNDVNAGNPKSGLKYYGRYISMAMSALSYRYKDTSHFTPYSGIVTRGMSGIPQNVIDNDYAVDKLITWPNFSSTSYIASASFGGNVKFEININPNLFLKLSNTDPAKDNPEQAKLREKMKNQFFPAKVDDISSYKVEKEVLLPPYMTFRVTHKEKTSHHWLIKMETTELPSLKMLARKGEWTTMIESIKAQNAQQQSLYNYMFTPWFLTDNTSKYEDSLVHQILEKVVEKQGAKTDGLDAEAQRGLETLKFLHSIMVQHKRPFDHLIHGYNKLLNESPLSLRGLYERKGLELPTNFPAQWSFDAKTRTEEDKQKAEDMIDGTDFQIIKETRVITDLEQWYHSNTFQSGVKKEIQILNNLDQFLWYEFWYEPSTGKMWEKAKPGQASIGNKREVRRLQMINKDTVGTAVLDKSGVRKELVPTFSLYDYY